MNVALSHSESALSLTAYERPAAVRVLPVGFQSADLQSIRIPKAIAATN